MLIRRNLARLFYLTIVITFAGHNSEAVAQFLVQDGLVSYWSFDANTIKGNRIKDLVGPNDCTEVGDPEPSQGKVGEALSFDGSEDGANCGNKKSLANIFDGGGTFMAWFLCRVDGAEPSRQNRRQKSVDTDASPGRRW